MVRLFSKCFVLYKNGIIIINLSQSTIENRPLQSTPLRPIFGYSYTALTKTCYKYKCLEGLRLFDDTTSQLVLQVAILTCSNYTLYTVCIINIKECSVSHHYLSLNRLFTLLSNSESIQLKALSTKMKARKFL